MFLCFKCDEILNVKIKIKHTCPAHQFCQRSLHLSVRKRSLLNIRIYTCNCTRGTSLCRKSRGRYVIIYNLNFHDIFKYLIICYIPFKGLLTRLHSFDKNKIKSNIAKYYYNLKQCFSILILYFKMWFIHVNFPVFSVTWSFRNHSNMLILCSRNVYYYHSWKQLCCLMFLWQKYLINRKFKRTALIRNTNLL